MTDFSRTVNVMLAALFLGVMGYLIGGMAFAGTASPGPRVVGAALGVVIGILGAVWVNTRSLAGR